MRATKVMDRLSGLYPGRRVSRKEINLEEDEHSNLSSRSSSESRDDNDEEGDGEMDEDIAYDKGSDDEPQEYDEERENGLAAGSFSLDPKMVIAQIVVFSLPDAVIFIIALTP